MPPILLAAPQDLASQPVKSYDDNIFSLINTLELQKKIALTDHVFTDADGTFVIEGTTFVAPEYIDALFDLAKRNVRMTLVTGKPLAEISNLIKSLPKDTPLQFICEKGAYSVYVDSNGKHIKRFILSSNEQERSVARLRRLFFKQAAPNIITATKGANGSQQVWFGLSGSGKHKSIFSLDIFGVEPPINYLKMIGEDREKIKLHDDLLLRRVEDLIEEFVNKEQPGWNVVHLGNGNTDIGPGGIEKNIAIEATSEFKSARCVQLWGDTMNDLAMFRLRQKHPNKVLTGLVLHREKSKPLLQEADMVTYGMANTAPYLQALLATHSRL